METNERPLEDSCQGKAVLVDVRFPFQSDRSVPSQIFVLPCSNDIVNLRSLRVRLSQEIYLLLDLYVIDSIMA